MELTAEALETIIGLSARKSMLDPRRRRSARVRTSIQGYLRLLKGGTRGDPEPVRISDLSTVGAGFVHDRQMGVGEEFGLDISRRDGSLLSVICIVKRCQNSQDGRYKIGAIYVRSDSISPGQTAAEKRRARRVAHEKRVEIRLCCEGQIAPPIMVIMQDFSTRGVGLIHSEEITGGEQFVLQLRTADEQFKRMLYTVARCRKVRDGRFLIGAEFTCVAPSAAA